MLDADTGISGTATVLNLVYNVPLVYQVIRNGSTRNLGGGFIVVRLLSALLWLWHGVRHQDWWLFASFIVTITSTGILLGYKVRDRLRKSQLQEEGLPVTTTGTPQTLPQTLPQPPPGQPASTAHQTPDTTMAPPSNVIAALRTLLSDLDYDHDDQEEYLRRRQCGSNQYKIIRELRSLLDDLNYCGSDVDTYLRKCGCA